MRQLAFGLSFLLGVLGSVACPPTKKCTPTNCTGCCSVNDTCEAGTSPSACGRGGLLCDACVGAQLCTAGSCEGAGTGGGTATGGGSATGGGGAGGASGSEFTGTYQERWGWDADGGRTASIARFSRATVGVWYRDGGMPAFIRGFGNDDGTFVVREVPSGEITLQLDRRFFVTTQRRLNFDTFVGGRLDAPRATAETIWRLTLRGLEPLSDDDTVGMVFTQNTGAVTNLENVARPVTPTGATSLESDLDWAPVSSALGYGLPDSTKGDLGYALQLRSTTTDAGFVSTVLRAAAIPPFSVVNGGSADVTTTLTAPPTEAVSVTLDRAAFTALRGSFGRSTSEGGFGFRVGASPAPAPHRFVSTTTTLLSVFASETLPLPTAPLPNPFPASWGRTASLNYNVPQPRSMTDGGTPTEFFGGVSMLEPTAFSGTVTPRITAVRGAQVEGRNFIEDQAGIGLTPSFSWMAPSTGTVSTYRLNIHRLDGTADSAELWRIYTPNPGVTVPPGVLVSGNAYVFEIDAMSFGEGGVTFTLPYAASTVVSGVMRP